MKLIYLIMVCLPLVVFSDNYKVQKLKNSTVWINQNNDMLIGKFWMSEDRIAEQYSYGQVGSTKFKTFFSSTEEYPYFFGLNQDKTAIGTLYGQPCLWIQNQGLSLIEFPFDYAEAQLKDINNIGTVVGYYVDLDDQQEGFIWDGQFTTFTLDQFSDQIDSSVNCSSLLSINDQGTLLGKFEDENSDTHFFVVIGGQFHLIPTDELQYIHEIGISLNNLNEVMISVTDNETIFLTYIWREDKEVQLLSDLICGQMMNDVGDVVGYFEGTPVVLNAKNEITDLSLYNIHSFTGLNNHGTISAYCFPNSDAVVLIKK